MPHFILKHRLNVYLNISITIDTKKKIPKLISKHPENYNQQKKKWLKHSIYQTMIKKM